MIRWRRSTVMQSANRVTSVTSPRFQTGLSARSSARRGRGSAKIRRHASGRPGGWPQILGRQFHLGQVPGADRAVVMDQRRRRERSGRHDDLADDAQHLAGVAAKRAVSQAVSGQGQGGGAPVGPGPAALAPMGMGDVQHHAFRRRCFRSACRRGNPGQVMDQTDPGPNPHHPFAAGRRSEWRSLQGPGCRRSVAGGSRAGNRAIRTAIPGRRPRPFPAVPDARPSVAGGAAMRF